MKHDLPSLRRSGFTLVELLVVIGIIALLIGILMPTINQARRTGERAKCMSNLKQLGNMLQIYASNNKGWWIPCGPDNPTTNIPTTLGTGVPPHLRWPVLAFGIKYKEPLPYNAATYPANTNDPLDWTVNYSAEPFTPKVLVCPSDVQPTEYHSYVLNEHMADNRVKEGRKMVTSDVIMAGEKKTEVRDYYMEGTNDSEFNRVVELYRHGAKLGSNYLYLDYSVRNVLPRNGKIDPSNGVFDPWGLSGVVNTPAPTTP
ncbi:MAG: prepilin-type N-terminal cleavage/methylation domain-containing protein [Tepidisphaeraceae bacterium]